MDINFQSFKVVPGAGRFLLVQHAGFDGVG